MTSMASNVGLQNIGVITKPQTFTAQPKENIFENLNWEPDIYVPQTKPQEKAEAPKISMIRILFGRLKQSQIDAVNESRQLPKNAKFKGDKPILTWNLIDFTQGTHTLPAGYELRNDIIGFTHVVREDAKAWYLKK